MLTHLDPASALAIALLIFCFVMVILFEATNGFHDAANAVASVIYTKSLSPVQAVVLSGFLNFLGVLLGGIAVAYTLVELIPAEVLSPPDGGPAVGMLVALFIAALFWNIGHVVAGASQLELALSHRLPDRRRRGQCARALTQSRRERALAAVVESSGGARRVAYSGIRARRAPVSHLPQDLARRESLQARGRQAADLVDARHPDPDLQRR
jgi:hypothetical protein